MSVRVLISLCLVASTIVAYPQNGWAKGQQPGQGYGANNAGGDGSTLRQRDGRQQQQESQPGQGNGGYNPAGVGSQMRLREGMQQQQGSQLRQQDGMQQQGSQLRLQDREQQQGSERRLQDREQQQQGSERRLQDSDQQGGRGGAMRQRNYNFKYQVDDEDSGNYYGHKEQAENGRVDGSYHVWLPSGRLMKVKYNVEGDSGYVPSFTFENDYTPTWGTSLYNNRR